MSSFNDIIEAASQVEQVWTDAAVGSADAVGVALDDPDEPRVAVTIHDGRIVYIGISDGMLHGDMADLQVTLNACIINAFAAWREEHSGRRVSEVV